MRTSHLSILALLPAVLLSLAAAGQVAPEGKSRSTDETPRTFKNDVYVGYAYTSLNQVNQSRYGLQGITAFYTRNFGKYFGLTAEGDYYSLPISKPVVVNSNVVPTVTSLLFGPEVHATIYGKFGGFTHALIGGEHTGGYNQTPNISFAGGVGGGMEYALSPRFSLRATGDFIGASFSLTGNSPQLGYSPHRSWNPRAGFGLVYRF